MGIITIKTNAAVLINAETEQSEELYFEVFKFEKVEGGYNLFVRKYYIDGNSETRDIGTSAKNFTDAAYNTAWNNTTFVQTQAAAMQTEFLTKNVINLIVNTGWYGISAANQLSVV